MDPELRRWWRLIEGLPAALRQVHRWATPQRRPPSSGTFHHVPTLIACLAGVVRVRRPGSPDLDLGVGDVVLIAPGVWHEHTTLKSGSIWFGQGFMAAWSDVVIGSNNRIWSGKLPHQPSRRMMEAALTAPDDGTSHLLVAELINQMLSESVTDIHFDHPALGKMLDRLWRRSHLGLTADELIAASGLQRAQAYAVFTTGYGVPPREAIATTRIWLAASYLQAALPVAEVARLAGYPSADTFARAWRRVHGKAPSDSR